MVTRWLEEISNTGTGQRAPFVINLLGERLCANVEAEWKRPRPSEHPARPRLCCLRTWDEGTKHKYGIMAREHHETSVQMAQVVFSMKPSRGGGALDEEFHLGRQSFRWRSRMLASNFMWCSGMSPLLEAVPQRIGSSLCAVYSSYLDASVDQDQRRKRHLYLQIHGSSGPIMQLITSSRHYARIGPD